MRFHTTPRATKTIYPSFHLAYYKNPRLKTLRLRRTRESTSPPSDPSFIPSHAMALRECYLASSPAAEICRSKNSPACLFARALPPPPSAVYAVAKTARSLCKWVILWGPVGVRTWSRLLNKSGEVRYLLFTSFLFGSLTPVGRHRAAESLPRGALGRSNSLLSRAYGRGGIVPWFVPCSQHQKLNTSPNKTTLRNF